MALDWHSGNRSVLVDHELSGVIVGLTLATRPQEVYRALLEATAFGTRTIVEAFEAAGVPVERARRSPAACCKNPFLMQIYADVTRRPLRLIELRPGARAGRGDPRRGRRRLLRRHPRRVGRDGPQVRDAYTPDEGTRHAYDALYAEYTTLHDYFGRGGDDGHAPRCGRSGGGAGADDAAVELLRREVCALHSGAACATAWSPGPAATCPRACRARS